MINGEKHAGLGWGDEDRERRKRTEDDRVESGERRV